jgi:hypothetical protein
MVGVPFFEHGRQLVGFTDEGLLDLLIQRVLQMEKPGGDRVGLTLAMHPRNGLRVIRRNPVGGNE